MKDVDTASHANNNTSYIVGGKIDQVISIRKMLTRLYLKGSDIIK